MARESEWRQNTMTSSEFSCEGCGKPTPNEESFLDENAHVCVECFDVKERQREEEDLANGIIRVVVMGETFKLFRERARRWCCSYAGGHAEVFADTPNEALVLAGWYACRDRAQIALDKIVDMTKAAMGQINRGEP